MRHATTILMISLLFTGGAAGAEPLADRNSGYITADSPLYDLDVAIDEALVDWNRKTPGDVAHERASEALVAQEANLTDARDRALDELNETVAQANGLRDGDGLEQAEALLRELQDQLPADAQPGLETAIDNVLEAKNRFPLDGAPGDQRPNTGQRGV